MGVRSHYLGLVIALCAARAISAGEPRAPGVEFFETKIRPVLVEQCYQCHSAAAQKTGRLKAALLLDSRNGMLKGGESGPAIRPGDAPNSLLISAIRHESLKMPPDEKLREGVVADFVAWIAMGAPDPRSSGPTDEPEAKPSSVSDRNLWSFVPLKKSQVPTVRDASWTRTPVDSFILKRLEEAGIPPNDFADRRTLIRRLSFDVRGLPPTPEEVQAFVSDPAPDAYSQLVDRYLDSPNFGERWARHWLDLARFMEGNGNAHDEDRWGAYHFRDFVIRAFNDDLPFDEFVRLQIAGDLMKPGDYFSHAATGFLASGPYTTEQTAKERERSRYDQFDDLISTVGTGMLGLTVGCARCHDHKYDPVSSEEYYRMVACFATTGFQDVPFDMDPERYQQQKAQFDKLHQPFVDRRIQYENDVLAEKLAEWEHNNSRTGDPQWVILEPSKIKFTSGASFRALPDGSVIIEGAHLDHDTYEVIFVTDVTGIRALRIEAIPDPALPGGGPGLGPDGSFELSNLAVNARAKGDFGKLTQISLRDARANRPEDQPNATALVGKRGKRSWFVNQHLDQTHAVAAVAENAFGFEGGTTINVILRFTGRPKHQLGRFRISFFTNGQSGATGATPDTIAVDASGAFPAVFAALRQPIAERSPATMRAVLNWFAPRDKRWRELFAEEVAHDVHRPRQPLKPVYAASILGSTYYFAERFNVYFLARGEPEQKKGLASPGFLRVLMSDPEKPELWTKNFTTDPPTTRQPRVAYANWLTDTRHGAGALMARVIVNRLWQHHVGRGIVNTPNDFGVRGERPTHPDLLEYLAAELVRNGWKLKPIHKLILTSSVYMQRGDALSAGVERDPENRLLWRHAPARIEAEIIRDAMLAAAGRLDTQMSGPGTLDETTFRRSIYFTIKHARPIPFLQLFDAPYSTNSIGERANTTGATQALALLNSPAVRSLAEHFAERLRSAHQSDMRQTIEDAWRIALSRAPTAEEREKMCRLIDRLAESYGDSIDAAQRALVDFCQLLFCSNEFMYVD